jgi:signal transduction histidine kinase
LYLNFILSIAGYLKKFWFLNVLLGPIVILFFSINHTSLFLDTVRPKYLFPFAPEAGPFYVYFAAYFALTIILSLAILFSRLYREKDIAKKKNYLLILQSSMAGFIGGGSVFFLTFNINFPPYPLPLFALYPTIIAYAMFRFQLFNIKLIGAQVFVLFISTVYVVKVILSQGAVDRSTNIIVLILTVGFGYLLVRGIKKEILQREEIDKLAKRLADTNWELSRKNEQLRIIDQRKSEFVSIVSHQLRTPVTAIKGYSSLILENAFGEITKPVREAVEKIFISSDRLAGMITDFLNISKIEQGTMTYSFSSVDLGKMLKELVDDFNVAAGKKKIDLSLSIPEQETFLVTADEGKIRQILSNLIDNAIKYTPMGKVHVSIEHSPDRTKVIVKVTDSGIGLSQDDIQHLFGKFARGAHGQKVFTDGSGLGLYVAKKMLEAHKGKIWVDSPGVGKGSTFAIELLAEDLPTQK